MAFAGVEKQLSLIILAWICYAILAVSAEACDEVYFVDPDGQDAGSFYVIEGQNGEWLRKGYIPAGTLIRSEGTSKTVAVPERLYGEARSYVPFVSEFGQTGFIRWNDIKDGALSKLNGAPVRGTSERINCDKIERFIAPDDSHSGIRILAAPTANSAVLDEPSASFMAAVFVVEDEYRERQSGGDRFLRVRYRVGAQGPVSIGYVDRMEQTDEAEPGRFRLTQSVDAVKSMIGVSSDRDCSGTCWVSVLNDLYNSVANLEAVGTILAQKPCRLAAEVKFTLSGGVEAKKSLAGWFNVGVSGGADASLKVIIPAGEVSTTGRWFRHNQTEIGIQRTHECVGSEKGPATFIGLRFAGYDEPARLFAADLEQACFSRLPASLRAYHTDGLFIVARSDEIVFPRYIALRHLVQDRIGRFVSGDFLSDTQLQELDRLTWLSIEQVLEHQHRQAYGVPPAPCAS